jgi:hypothetical protein
MNEQEQKTPLTDAARFTMDDTPLGDWVHADAAEELERAAQASNQSLVEIMGWVRPRLDEWKQNRRGMAAFSCDRMEALEAIVGSIDRLLSATANPESK